MLSIERIYFDKCQSNLSPGWRMKKRALSIFIFIVLSKELSFQINLKSNAAGNLPSVMWFPLKPLQQVSSSCSVLQLKERKTTHLIQTDVSQTTEFLGLISTTYIRQTVDFSFREDCGLSSCLLRSLQDQLPDSQEPLC